DFAAIAEAEDMHIFQLERVQQLANHFGVTVVKIRREAPVRWHAPAIARQIGQDNAVIPGKFLRQPDQLAAYLHPAMYNQQRWAVAERFVEHRLPINLYGRHEYPVPGSIGAEESIADFSHPAGKYEIYPLLFSLSFCRRTRATGRRGIDRGGGHFPGSGLRQ